MFKKLAELKDQAVGAVSDIDLSEAGTAIKGHITSAVDKAGELKDSAAQRMTSPEDAYGVALSKFKKLYDEYGDDFTVYELIVMTSEENPYA